MAPHISPHGIWHVTTEGDCEGRTTKDLGIHEGYIDDIAFALAGSTCYKLDFRPVDVNELSRSPRTGTEVHVCLPIESKTWDMRQPARADYFRRMLAGRDVAVSDSNYYAAVKLTRGTDPERQAAARRDALRNTALSKLNADEIAALGLKQP